MFGIILMKCGRSVEFIMQNEDMRTVWVEKLKPYCVLMNLNHHIEVSKLLGQGNFAKVNLCHRRKNISQQFALKTIRKKKKNGRVERNKVSFSFSISLPFYIFTPFDDLNRII